MATSEGTSGDADLARTLDAAYERAHTDGILSADGLLVAPTAELLACTAPAPPHAAAVCRRDDDDDDEQMLVLRRWSRALPAAYERAHAVGEAHGEAAGTRVGGTVVDGMAISSTIFSS
jgi:hypothetical protein